MKREIVGVVMCGGESRRMGEDKAALEIRPGATQLDRQLELLGMVCKRLAVSSGSVAREVPNGVASLSDAEGVAGPMAGVIASLRHAEGWPALVVACDMPFLEMAHLVQLANRRDSQRLATAFLAEDQLPDPMCAIYECNALPLLEEAARRGQTSLRDFLRSSQVELIEAADKIFLASVDDRQQLDWARRRLRVD